MHATHTFLSESEIQRIKTYVPEALAQIAHLVIEVDDYGSPNAFMGIDGDKIEMLFVAPSERGKGIGTKLVTHALSTYHIAYVYVNEQNPQAVGFYEHCGFTHIFAFRN